MVAASSRALSPVINAANETVKPVGRRVAVSRGGAGAYVRTLQQYKGGKYQTVRVADYQEDKDCVLRFVRERSATNAFAPTRDR